MTRIFKHTITESGEDIILFFKGKDRFDYFLNKSKEHSEGMISPPNTIGYNICDIAYNVSTKKLVKCRFASSMEQFIEFALLHFP